MRAWSSVFVNRINRALELFNGMTFKGCSPNNVAYNSFIRYCSFTNEMDRAIEMLQNMRLSGHGIPTSSSYTPVIHALCKSGSLTEAQEFLVEWVEEGCIPSVHTYELVQTSKCSQCSKKKLICLMNLAKGMNVGLILGVDK